MKKLLLFLLLAFFLGSCTVSSKLNEKRKAHWHKVHKQGAWAGRSFIPANDSLQILKHK